MVRRRASSIIVVRTRKRGRHTPIHMEPILVHIYAIRNIMSAVALATTELQLTKFKIWGACPGEPPTRVDRRNPREAHLAYLHREGQIF